MKSNSTRQTDMIGDKSMEVDNDTIHSMSQKVINDEAG